MFADELLFLPKEFEPLYMSLIFAVLSRLLLFGMLQTKLSFTIKIPTRDGRILFIALDKVLISWYTCIYTDIKKCE